jgi:hypothetical protein
MHGKKVPNLLLNERNENSLKFDMLANANQKISRILDEVRQWVKRRAKLHIFHMIVMNIKIFYTSASIRPTDIARHIYRYGISSGMVTEKNVPLSET